MSQQVKITSMLDLLGTAFVKGIKVAAKTTNYTVLKDDSGTVLVANNAANLLGFTLPAVADCGGRVFIFLNKGAAGMRVTGGTADKMVIINDATANYVSYETANTMVGAACAIFGDGSSYYFMELGTSTQSVA